MILNNINNHKAFTLVELLVTIAIIGLLITIVLVSFSGQSDKARIAKTLQWSRSIQSLLGADAAGIWTFDEGLATTAFDSSGYENHGTIYGAAYTTETPSGHGYALNFNGVSDYVDIGKIMTGNILQLYNTNFTIAVWIKPTVSGDNYQRIIDKSNGPSAANGWGLTLSSNPTNGFNFYIDGSAVFMDRGGNIPDTWTHVIVIKDASGSYEFYQDGILINSFTGKKDPPLSEQNCRIGTWNHDDAREFNGIIDDVRIYETALTSVQIEALYYVGLDNLYAKGLIDEQEYQKRLLAKQGF